MSIFNKKWVDSNVDRKKAIIIPKSINIQNENLKNQQSVQNLKDINDQENSTNDNIENNNDIKKQEIELDNLLDLPLASTEEHRGNLFPRTNKKSRIMPCIEVTSTSMVVYKEPLFKKFINKFKLFFGIKRKALICLILMWLSF